MIRRRAPADLRSVQKLWRIKRSQGLLAYGLPHLKHHCSKFGHRHHPQFEPLRALPSPFVESFDMRPTQFLTLTEVSRPHISFARSGRAAPFAMSFAPDLYTDLPCSMAARNRFSRSGIAPGCGAAAVTAAMTGDPSPLLGVLSGSASLLLKSVTCSSFGRKTSGVDFVCCSFDVSWLSVAALASAGCGVCMSARWRWFSLLLS